MGCNHGAFIAGDIEDKANPAARLEELHYILFGESFEMAHDALLDIEAMARCYWGMKERGTI